MKAKEVILLILIVAAGIFFYHIQTGKIPVNVYFDDGIFFSLNEYIYEDIQEIEPPLPSEVQIINSHGDIEIQGTKNEKITVSFRKKIWRKNEEEAKKVDNLLRMIINQDDQRLIISTNRNEFRKKNFETFFTVFVPEKMAAKLKNSYGLVKVSNLTNTDIINHHGKIIASNINGNITINNSCNDIEVENIQSDCQIDSHHSKVSVYHVKGDAQISHRYGKINLENISQEVTVEGSHTAVYGQNIGGPVRIESSYEKISLFNVGQTFIRGNHCLVEVDSSKGLDIKDNYSKVRVKNIQGDLFIDGKNLGIFGKTIIGNKISISSSNKDVVLNDFSGKTTIFLSHGDIFLTPFPLTQSIEVKNKYSNIKFYWPSGNTYYVEARSKQGDIHWGLPYEMNFLEENAFSILKAFDEEKDKPSIFLSTTYGSIRIEE